MARPRPIPLRVRSGVSRTVEAILVGLADQAAAQAGPVLDGATVVLVVPDRLETGLADWLWRAMLPEAEADVAKAVYARPIVPTPVSEVRSAARVYADRQSSRLVVQITEETRTELRRIVRDFMGRIQRTGPTGAPSWKIPVSGPRFSPGSSWRSEGMTQAMKSHISAKVGLTERQAAAVGRYADQLQAELVGGPRAPARALERLRGAGRKQVTSQAEVDRLVKQYAANWRTYRAETIAATETHGALMAGRQAAWERAIARGRLAPDAVRVWRTNHGDARVCPQCEALDGAVSAMSGTFTGGDTTTESPPIHPRCRCWMEVQEPDRFTPDAGDQVEQFTDVTDVQMSRRRRKARIFR